ncbi:MAG: TIGR04149 family rSAM-modified RiPP [Tannerella sp.]|jgi:natural product precursor|nr:TIGR04149 family rSAM-modified RiPP [Tannerella sp.]
MKTIKKLKLNKRAVINLDGGEMRQLVGGYGQPLLTILMSM